jgi:hypothetical protein
MMLNFVLAVLATWRVTHLLASEDGPGDVIFRLRRALGQSLTGNLMDCFNCLSFWIAAPLAVFVSRQPSVWFMTWLAVSGGACLLERMAREPVIVQSLTQSSLGDPGHVLWKDARTADNAIPADAESDSEFQEKRSRQPVNCNANT